MAEKSLIDETIKNLNQNGFEACFCQTVKEAVEKVLSLIPSGASVGFGGSMSCVDSGLLDRVRTGPYKVIDREKAGDSAERRALMKKCLTADVFLTSFNAVSKNGSVFNIDGNGNRVAAITFGPDSVIALVGVNKLCNDEESAKERVLKTAAVKNAIRFGKTAEEADSICNIYQKVVRGGNGRIKVVICGEELGY